MIKPSSMLLLVLALVGCLGDLDEGITDTRCVAATSPKDVTVTVPTKPTFVTGTATVKLRGEATHTQGLAIRRITVAGLDAASDAFNFSAWSLDLPADLVTAKVPAMATLPQTVTFTANAYDVCNDNVVAGAADATITVAAPP